MLIERSEKINYIFTAHTIQTPGGTIETSENSFMTLKFYPTANHPRYIFNLLYH